MPSLIKRQLRDKKNSHHTNIQFICECIWFTILCFKKVLLCIVVAIPCKAFQPFTLVHTKVKLCTVLKCNQFVFSIALQ